MAGDFLYLGGIVRPIGENEDRRVRGAGSPIVFTSVNDNLVGGATGTGTPAPADWGGISLGSGQTASTFDYVVFKYAAEAIHVALLDVLPVTNSVFSYNQAAFVVDSTSGSNPLAGAADCVPPVRGHEKVSTGGQLRSPLVATKSPHWWPGKVPALH